MIKELFFEDKTIPGAVEKAAASLGVDKDLLSYEVVTMPVKGIFGIGAVSAKIKVEQEVPDPVVKPVEKGEFVEKIAKKDHPVDRKPKSEKAPAKKAPEYKKPAKEPLPAREKAPAADDEVSAVLRNFLKGALDEMGLKDAEIYIGSHGDNIYEIDVSGSKMGVLIGRRGETLDAMQYLSSLIVNRKFEQKIKVVLDTENYRAKRTDALERLAKKTAEKAVRYKKNIALEPMSPYERRIIHAVLTDVPHITTFSVGSEPKRKVVISYTEE